MATMQHQTIKKAEMLNNYFSNCLNHSAPPLSFADRDDLDAVELTDIDDIPDGISARMLRETAKSIAPSITNIFNLSLKTGSFPTLWKTSHVVPIPKSENRTSPSNYWPISLLSILSKVLERHVHGLITEHLSLTHPLAINQWGFRARRSTTLALFND